MRIQDDFIGVFNLNKLLYLLYLFGKTGLNKQCRPGSDAAEVASDQGPHCLLLIQQFYTHSYVVNGLVEGKYKVKGKDVNI